MLHDPNRRDIFPGERAIVLSEPRHDWRAGATALVVVLGAAIGSWLTLSSPQDASMAGLVPAAEAAGLFAAPESQPHRLNRAGPIQEAQATTAPAQPDTAPSGQDLVKVQVRLKALGYDPGTADGRPGKRTPAVAERISEIIGAAGNRRDRPPSRGAVSRPKPSQRYGR